jgi:hypothetical protein
LADFGRLSVNIVVVADIVADAARTDADGMVDPCFALIQSPRYLSGADSLMPERAGDVSHLLIVEPWHGSDSA